MKYFILLLALAASSYGVSLSRASFDEHLPDFLELIDAEVGDEIRALEEAYLEEDEAFVATLEYLRSQNFNDLLQEMESLDEFVAVTTYLTESGIDIETHINILHDILGIEVAAKKSSALSRQRTGTGFNGFIEDLINLLPREQLEALFIEKYESDEEFRATTDRTNSEEFSNLVDALFASETFQSEIADIEANGVDIGLLLVAVDTTLGHIPPPLPEDLRA